MELSLSLDVHGSWNAFGVAGASTYLHSFIRLLIEILLLLLLLLLPDSKLQQPTADCRSEDWHMMTSEHEKFRKISSYSSIFFIEWDRQPFTLIISPQDAFGLLRQPFHAFPTDTSLRCLVGPRCRRIMILKGILLVLRVLVVTWMEVRDKVKRCDSRGILRTSSETKFRRIVSPDA